MPVHVPNVWFAFYERRTPFQTERDNILLIGIHPLDWLTAENEDDDESVIFIISFQEIHATRERVNEWKQSLPYYDDSESKEDDGEAEH